MSFAVELRPHQVVAAEDIDKQFASGATVVMSILPTGAGKCHGVDTPIMMFDGSIKMVQDVEVGELLMGPDSKPREVLTLARGREELFKVTPVKGDAYVVNKSHILSLKKTGTYEVVNLPLTEYLESNSTFKHTHKGWRTGVEFDGEISAEYLPPYLLGIWLGDGTSRNASITSADIEIAEYVDDWCNESGQDLRVQEQEGNASSIYHITGQRRRSNTTHQDLINYGLILNKHIPHEYKVANREHRLELLAGILDSDGHLTHGGYDVVFKQKVLADDTVYLARSLGFAAYVKPCCKTCTNTGTSGDYWRISISGDMSLVPTKLERHQPDPRKQKKNVLVTGITVESIGEGDYFGFTITGDHLYLLGDFTVTHNTIVKAHYARQCYDNGETCVLIAHRDVLLGQISDALCMYQVPHSFICSDDTRRDITNINYKEHGHHYHDERSRIIVISVATFAARIRGNKIPKALMDSVSMWLMDEGHHLTQGSQWGNCIESFPNARGLAVTATPIRGDRKGLGRHAHGYVDKMSVTSSMIDLVKAGRLTQMKVYAPTQLNTEGLTTTAGGDFNQKKLYERTKEQGSKITGSAVEHYIKFIYGQPAITFAVNIEHGKHIAEKFNAAGIPTQFVSSKSKESVRKKAVQDLRDGVLWNLVNVDLFGEGFDAPAVTGVFFLRKTESYSLFKQQMGRCLRPSEGKTYGFIFDHVGNVARMLEKYNLSSPYHDPEWTLDSYGKGGSNGDGGEDLPPTITCPECSYEAPLKSYYDEENDFYFPGFLQDDGTYLCPDEDCRHAFSDEESENTVRKIQEKEGNLVELSFDDIDDLIRKRDEEVFKPVAKMDYGPYARANMSRHVDRQNAITVLRHKINSWCNALYNETKWSGDLIRREFESTFKVNIYQAQVLSAPAATKLAEDIQRNAKKRTTLSKVK
ncbi:helicase/UvrB [Vibrio phage 393E50-1]|nr:helicase/UvrB [Vibrio phage 393E50-1]